MKYHANMLADLKRSGLDARDAMAMGLAYEAFTNSYKIPYRNVDGIDTGFFRTRFLDPAAENKYGQAPNSVPHPYFPPIEGRPWREIVENTSVDLVFPEGEKKAALACKHGVPAIGLGGAYNWRSTKAGIDFLPELEDVKWQDRTTFIVFDSDAKRETRAKVRKAAERLAAELRSRGATVHIVTLPRTGNDKVGLDDFIVANGIDALRGLLADAGKQQNDGEVIYERMDHIMAETIHWLWPDRIARGKLTLIVGDPGLGKSQITINIAATVTTGGAFHDGAKCEPGNVVILSAEDDAKDTLKPRLAAVGADMTRVFLLRGVRDDTAERPFNLGLDLPRLDAMLAKIGGAAMVIIDPISAYLGNVDSHRNSEVRALLMPLGSLAARHITAFAGVSHLNKSGDNAALLRVTGSLAFVAAARAVYVVVKDKDSPDERRLFLPLKNNIGKDKTGFAYSVQGSIITLDGKKLSTSRVVWEKEPVAMTADDALAKLRKTDTAALDAAKAFLSATLTAGPVPMKQIESDAHGAGHSMATIRRAKDDLKIKAVKEPGDKGKWIWTLPARKF